MSGEFKAGDRVRVGSFEGVATCVVGGSWRGCDYFGIDVVLDDDGGRLTVRSERMVEKVTPTPPAPGEIIEFVGGSVNTRFVMNSGGMMTRLWSDGLVSPGYNWSGWSDRAYKVASFV